MLHNFQWVQKGHYVGVLPETITFRTAAQFAASLKDGVMKHFDHGSSRKNQLAYGQPTPPVYDVTRITSRGLAIVGANNDTLVPADNLARLVKLMKGEQRSGILKPSFYSYCCTQLLPLTSSLLSARRV